MFLKTYPVRWRRQATIGNYVVDFYCAKAKLALELDGGGHYTPEQTHKDAERTKELEQMGITVHRFCNTDVDRNFSGVCEQIDLLVKQMLLP